MIVIDNKACVGCGLCVRDCFPAALALSGRTAALVKPENCIGCGHCIAICPQAAVRDDRLPGDDMVPAKRDIDGAALLTLMRSRRSCRQYRSDPVADETVRQLLEAARACPTAKNLQATRYILVREQIPALLDAALGALGNIGAAQLETATEPDERRRAENFLRWSRQRQADRSFDPLFFHAPLLLLFIAEPETANDAAAGAAYAELMAASLGLGCLYSGYFTACAGMSPEIQAMLGLKDRERVVRCLVLGYPAVRYVRTPPRNVPEVTSL